MNTATATPTVATVQISNPTAQDRRDGLTGFLVEPAWTVPGLELDRPNTGGWWVTDRKMAERLTAALLDGAVHDSPEVAYDINGATYVRADRKVIGRYMDGDLRALGY